jgi:hypothetical protein
MIEHDFYLQELAVARPALIGPAVIVSAALAAMLTLTGATRVAKPVLPGLDTCQRCLLEQRAPSAAPDRST